MVEMDENMLVVDPEREELLQIVAAKKAELPAMDRKVLELHYEDGYSINEISEMLKVGVPRLKRILASAIYEMKKKLEYEI